MSSRSARAAAFILALMLLLGLPASALANPGGDIGGEPREVSGELVGMFQAGHMEGPQEMPGQTLVLRAGGEEQAKADIKAGIQNLAEEIDISYLNYAFPEDKQKLGNLVLTVVNSNPQLFYVKTGYSLSYWNGKILSVSPVYIPGAEKLVGEYEAEIQRVLDISGAKSLTTDTEKALALHDTLAQQVKYHHAAIVNDESRKANPHAWTAYGAIVNKECVCQGYSLAYIDLLKRVGVDSMYVVSDSMNHAWNLVNAEGSWYHVDITWDDPTNPSPDGDEDWGGYSRHTYFLKTDNEFKTIVRTHQGWSTDGLPAVAGSKHANTSFWDGVISGMFYDGSQWIYSNQPATYSNVSDNKGTLCTTKFGTSKSGTELIKNTVLPVRDGNKLYYYRFDSASYNNYPGKFYSYDLISKKETLITEIPKSGYYINEVYAKNDGKILYNEAPYTTPLAKNVGTYTIKDESAVKSLALDQATAALTVNDDAKKSFKLAATVDPAGTKITWTSSNPAIATVDDGGNVTAVAAGTAVITASAGGKSATCTVTVDKKVVSINITGGTEVAQGKTLQLTATVDPADATNAKVTWASSNPDIASVDANGLVLGKADGTVTITATAGGVSMTTSVKVIPHAASIAVAPATASIDLASATTTQLTAKVAPANAVQKVSWSSSDNSIATVDENGKVTGLALGNATITATATDGTGVKGTAAITVVHNGTYVVESIKGQTEGELKVAVNGVHQLTATVKPAGGKVSWTSSNPSIATVNADGLVTGVAAGEVEISATPEKGVAVKVKIKVEAVTKPITKIVVSGFTALKSGESKQLDLAITPSDATTKTATWSSSDESIATVAQDGTVTAKDVLESRTVVITATAGDSSGVKGSITITVSPEYVMVANIALTNAEVEVGQSAQIAHTITPNDAKMKELTWISGNESVATVDDKGVVTGHTVGTATITATAKDKAGKSATCTVTVKAATQKVTALSLTGPEEVFVGETITLKATVEPADATNSKLDYTSSNEAAATIDPSGKVTPKQVNENTVVTFSASTTDGSGLTASHIVTIKPKPQLITKITLSGATELMAGNSATIKAAIEPTNASNQELDWTSSDANSATVDLSGKVTAADVSGKKEVTITATARDGSKVSATHKITILPRFDEKITKLAANPTSLPSSGGNTTLTITLDKAASMDHKLVLEVSGGGKVTQVNADIAKGRNSVSLRLTLGANSTTSSITYTVKAKLAGKDFEGGSASIMVQGRSSSGGSASTPRPSATPTQTPKATPQNTTKPATTPTAKPTPQSTITPEKPPYSTPKPSGWRSEGGKQRYYTPDGKLAKGWVKDSATGAWYYTDPITGDRLSGWQKVESNGTSRWYYLDPAKGDAMKTGWLKDKGKWYYLKSSGAMQTGWLKDRGKWYYLNASGAMQTGWQKLEWNGQTDWYYFNANGAMRTGWLQYKGKWYYLRASGRMQTGWLEVDGRLYYLNAPNGDMATGTKVINGKRYRFDANGALIR